MRIKINGLTVRFKNQILRLYVSMNYILVVDVLEAHDETGYKEFLTEIKWCNRLYLLVISSLK